MSKSQVNKLGDRLKRLPSISDADRDPMEDFRAAYDAPMRAVAARITEHLGLEANPRLKTVGTIIEKLRREQGSKLASIQDIAGVRIVQDMSRRQQDELVGKLVELFPGSRVKDRRAEPSYGYRAVHLIATVEGLPVEIQVRTQVQHAWAEMIEKLADRWGRGIRYGGTASVPKIGLLVEKLRELADRWSQLEELRPMIEDAESKLAVLEARLKQRVIRLDGQPDEQLQEIMDGATSVGTLIAELRADQARQLEGVEPLRQMIIDLCNMPEEP